MENRAGKTIIPFNSYGVSVFSRTISTIEEMQPETNVTEDCYSVTHNEVENSKDEVIVWLENLK
ncbi:hypothetical protein [Clostridium sp. DL-VIII]|uniref:hypothetical protein n=1 Tax=Clostridium sp. DL-VIII TaxID=641107 RepID=UPI000309455B|nr:hypothetical protein [Clostridium sp. DL-VIII]